MEFGSTALMFALIKLLGMKNPLVFRYAGYGSSNAADLRSYRGIQSPTDCTYSTTATLYVADAVGGYAVRYSRDLVRMGTLGSPTDAEFPHFVERDAMNRLVPDHRNSWIKRCYEDGTFIDMFRRGMRTLRLWVLCMFLPTKREPHSTTDYHAHRILKFDPDGTFCRLDRGTCR